MSGARVRASWPGADLLAARSLERIARRHRAALVLTAAGALLVRVARRCTIPSPSSSG